MGQTGIPEHLCLVSEIVMGCKPLCSTEARKSMERRSVWCRGEWVGRSVRAVCITMNFFSMKRATITFAWEARTKLDLCQGGVRETVVKEACMKEKGWGSCSQRANTLSCRYWLQYSQVQTESSEKRLACDKTFIKFLVSIESRESIKNECSSRELVKKKK